MQTCLSPELARQAIQSRIADLQARKTRLADSWLLLGADVVQAQIERYSEVICALYEQLDTLDSQS